MLPLVDDDGDNDQGRLQNLGEELYQSLDDRSKVPPIVFLTEQFVPAKPVNALKEATKAQSIWHWPVGNGLRKLGFMVCEM